MSGIGFLMIVVVITIVGSAIVWLRHRQPTNPLASVDDFQREMQALGTTPPAVADGHLEARPRSPMNTVSVRPKDNPIRPVATAGDDQHDVAANDDPVDQSGPERN
jgi:hypothetical protein